MENKHPNWNDMVPVTEEMLNEVRRESGLSASQITTPKVNKSKRKERLEFNPPKIFMVHFKSHGNPYVIKDTVALNISNHLVFEYYDDYGEFAIIDYNANWVDYYEEITAEAAEELHQKMSKQFWERYKKTMER